MFEPMYDPVISLFGIPASVVLLAAGGVLSIAGALWLRRILGGDPEIESFWATAGPRRNWALIAGIALAGLAIALAIVALRP